MQQPQPWSKMMEHFLETVSVHVTKGNDNSQPRLRAVRIDAFTISTCDIYVRCVPGVGGDRQIEAVYPTVMDVDTWVKKSLTW